LKIDRAEGSIRPSEVSGKSLLFLNELEI